MARHRELMRLLFATLLCVALATPAAAEPPLRTIVEEVPDATGYRYGVQDDLGNSMTGLKIEESPSGGYVGVYHAVADGRSAVKLGDESGPAQLALPDRPGEQRLAAHDLRPAGTAPRWSPMRAM